jgi:signal transduction histidine kinase
VQQGLIPFNPIERRLLEVVEESTKNVLEQAKIKGVEITVGISDNLTVFAESYMLQCIIRNLVSNALKFTRKGGIITISASVGEDKKVVVAIKDTGIGMSKDLVDKLFQLHVQTGRPGTDGEPSTGLGLVLCKEFIEKNGGKLWVESEVGKGSNFYFSIPLNVSV